MTLAVRPIQPGDLAVAESLLNVHLGNRMQARMEELLDVLSYPGFIAEDDGEHLGVLTYRDEGDAVEIVAVCSSRRGCGRALIDAVKNEFPGKSLWLVTTNDNIRALTTYRRQGFRLVELRADAVARARELKPSIPMTSADGVPIRDEFVLRFDPP